MPPACTRPAIFLAVFGFVSTVFVPSARADDPPARVGRVSYAEGSVSFHAPDQTQWSFAAINYPVTTGLSFYDDADGRTEIQIGSSIVRMDHATEVTVLQLTDAVTQIEVDQGAINYRLGDLAPGQTAEVETPHGAVSLLQPGTYHIVAGDETHPAIITTLEGQARFIGQQTYLDIAGGEQATAIGEPVSYTMAQAEPDEFDNWSLQRDERERYRETIRYVSPETTGYQDLDRYGSWRSVPDYGEVWIPSEVPAGWAPYREGHWAWVAPWGWTWIDDQPWGFTPFHYGRWAQVGGDWAWVPGTLDPHPVYAPALVAFTTPPPRPELGLGLAAAAVGWLALAPHEVYNPPYHPSAAYLRGINRGTVSPAALQDLPRGNASAGRTIGTYANQRGATLVPQAVFTGAQAVQHATLPLPATFRALPAAPTLGTLKPTSAAHMAAATAPKIVDHPAAGQERTEEREVHAANRAGGVARPTAPVIGGPVAPVMPKRQEAGGQAESNPQAARPVARQASIEQKTATASGPAIRPPHFEADLRQKTLEQSLHVQAAAAKPVPARLSAPSISRAEPTQVVFHPAPVQKPAQAAPLHTSPDGWKREQVKPPVSAGEHKPADDRPHL